MKSVPKVIKTRMGTKKYQFRTGIFGLLFFGVLLFSTAIHAESTEIENGSRINLDDFNLSGNVLVFDALPNVAWIIGSIENRDYFHFRRIIRRNSIDIVVLSSPGGSVYEGLQIAAAVHDQGISTFVPNTARCASACSYIFFAGLERIAHGRLGVHQFYGSEDEGRYDQIQFTVSEIVGFLNEFQTPPVVFELMFQDTEMYYFDETEKSQIERYGSDETTVLDQGTMDTINVYFEALARSLERTNDQNDDGDLVPQPEEEVDPTDTETIAAVQKQLNRVGCNSGLEDGIIGPRSRMALRYYLDNSNSNYAYNDDLFTDLNFLESISGETDRICSPEIVRQPSQPTVGAPQLTGTWARAAIACSARHARLHSLIRGSGRLTVSQTGQNSYQFQYIGTTRGRIEGSGLVYDEREHELRGPVRITGFGVFGSFDERTNLRWGVDTTLNRLRGRYLDNHCSIGGPFLPPR